MEVPVQKQVAVPKVTKSQKVVEVETVEWLDEVAGDPRVGLLRGFRGLF